ncbi:PAS domain S-box protein [Geoglobus acetivorans]|uniref:histidine kinase n=1 Tax=Geoglobus acetivorans TaxID=565033 RepID=A0ABZ3H2N7_GEOAI|nr:PAS domain S-box protein [Geoglobus acetivorans]
MSIIVIRNLDDIRDCDIAVIPTGDFDETLLKEAKMHSKFVVVLGDRMDSTDHNTANRIAEMLSDFELFEMIVNQSPDPIIIYNDDQILYANPKAKEFLDSRDLKNTIMDRIHPDYRAFIENGIKKVLCGEDVDSVEVPLIMPDGGELWVEANPSLVNFRGRPAILLIFRDITERKKKDEKLRESEEKFRKVFENSPDLIAILNRDGVFIEANPSMIKSLGTNPVGKSIYDVLPIDVAEWRMQMVRKVIEENAVVSFKDRRDGKYFFNQVIPVQMGGERLCLVISVDITEYLRLGKLLRTIIRVHEAIARAKNREELVKRVEEILVDYSAKITNEPEGMYFGINYGGRNYGYLCMENVGDAEKELLQSLAEDLAFAIKAIDDANAKNVLSTHISGNISVLAHLVDKIRNPLTAIRGYAETLIDDDQTREKILQAVDRIVEIIGELDDAWGESEKVLYEPAKV